MEPPALTPPTPPPFLATIIAGGRDINDRDAVHKAIKDSGFQITRVVCGESTGVDMIGKEWAVGNNVPVASFPADWERYGKAAGPIRNREMAENADALILVWDGQSRGSGNMKQEAQKRGLMIYEVVV